ncbi:MAG TPA: OB-fold-containig protein [Abditibacteriaceae bacterium]|jgi:hypothetical protein
MSLLLAAQNWPFSLALGVCVALALLQLLAGFGEADVEADGDGLDGVLAWLGAGGLPLSLAVMLLAGGFGLVGLGIQSYARSSTGAFWNTGFIALLALVATLPLTRVLGGILRKILPRDESEAVSLDSFAGQSAVVSEGTARRGAPAQARVRDRFGKTHYLLVEPDEDGVAFPAGTAILLLTRHDHIFHARDDSHAQQTLNNVLE